MHLDPYLLLGVTPDTPLPELRAAFYELSLICHPDKGGDPQDMRMVIAAYRYLVEQLHHRIDSEFRLERYNDSTTKILPLSEIRCESLGITPAEIQARFDECLAAREVPPDMLPLLASIRENHLVSLITQDLFRYDHRTSASIYLAELVESLITRTLQHEPSYASIPGGYEDQMANSTEDPLFLFGQQEIITYTEPQTLPIASSVPYVYKEDITKTSLPDYTTEDLLDYRVAYQEPAPQAGTGTDAAMDMALGREDLEELYASMVLARELQDLGRMS